MEKTILISGAAGSIGSELTRQLINAKNVKKIVCIDFNENGLFNLSEELNKNNKNLDFLCLDLSNDFALEILGSYHFSEIYHAAAFKHVKLSQRNSLSYFKNNIGATITLLKKAKSDNSKFVQVSTDKAVEPNNIMGFTKRICEFLVLSETLVKSKIVRFGNVLNSNGSVIPIFKKQIKNGGPVTITHPDMVRYFMSINDAVELILNNDFSKKLQILNMGPQIKIRILAKNMIEEAGKKVVALGKKTSDDEIEIEYIGARPGEKIREKLSYGKLKEDGDFFHPEESIAPQNDLREYILNCYRKSQVPDWETIDWKEGCLK